MMIAALVGAVYTLLVILLMRWLFPRKTVIVHLGPDIDVLTDQVRAKIARQMRIARRVS